MFESLKEKVETLVEEVTEGSTFKVPYTKIVRIDPHTNAHSLEIATVYGFQIVVKKDVYKPGDKVILVPIDSVLPKNLEEQIFPVGSKITLHNSRVRQIRIRGFASQGMLLNPSDVAHIVNMDYISLEQDLSAVLGITKYEPPYVGPAQTIGKDRNRNKKSDHPLFHKYNSLNSIKWFPDLFQEGQDVTIQCKLHGTNARLGLLPYQANTLWKKFKKLVGLAPAYERVYGSNNVDISARSNYKGYYDTDLYGDCFKSINAFDKLKPGEIVYGEIIGPGIQKNYDYGLDHHRFVVFDVKLLQEDNKLKWMSPLEVEAYCKERGFEHVPILYRGPYNKELAYSLTKGPSVYNPVQKVREGIVIKDNTNYNVEGNKNALKWVSEDFLDDKTNSDNH